MTQTKKSFKSILNSHISLSFLLKWNWNDKYVQYTPSRSSLENHTWFQTKMGSVYPFSDQNGAKTLPGGAAHTYIAYIQFVMQIQANFRMIAKSFSTPFIGYFCTSLVCYCYYGFDFVSQFLIEMNESSIKLNDIWKSLDHTTCEFPVYPLSKHRLFKNTLKNVPNFCGS